MMLDEIIQLHRAGQLPEAEAGYRDLLAASPEDAEVVHLLGILRGQAGDHEEALALVLRAIELDDQRDVFQHTLGEMQLRAGNLDAAQAAYLRAKELNPNLTSAHSGLGQIAFLRGDLEAAEHHFRIALRADGDDAQSLAGLGNIHFSRGELRRASTHLTRAAELSPNDALIQGSLASVMLALNMLDFAVRAANNALALKPDYAMARAVLGNALLLKSDAAGAREAFEALLAQGEQIAPAHLGLGDIARLQQRHEEAIGHYEQALQQQPELHPAAIRRADSLARSGRVDQAIAQLRERALAFPQAPYVKVALASLLGQRGRHAEAVPLWREAVALLPDNLQAKANLALALDRAGEHEAAADLAEHVGGPPRPALVLVRARVALGAGDGQRALDTLRSLDESQWQELPELARRRQKLLGLTHDSLEQWNQAVQAFQRALPAAAQSLPELPQPDEALLALLRERAGEPVAREPQIAAPVLLTGLPGSGVGALAALLGDQPELAVRRDRFTAATDFISTAFDERLLRPLSQTDLAFLQRRYVRPLQRGGVREGVRVIDWLPYLDARVLPALKRALPGVRIVLVQSDPRDALLNWLAFGANAKLVMREPLEAARWMKAARAHQAIAAELLPACSVEADAILAQLDGAQGKQLAAFLGLERLLPGPLTKAAEKNRRGMPVAFAPGHARHYHEALAEPFAALE
ncbi:MAG TPA: tetratricopeptide repeat protein [Rhodanobacteraceae bacterium]|nr:tetratricopeptide repeat protein [Rhodanobacteraceae bacterium]